MSTYTLELVSTSSIKEDVSRLAGHKDLWRVTCGVSLVAYCADKGLADRIAHGDFYRPTISPTGNLFSYPSSDSPQAICVGTTNTLLHEDDKRKNAV
jgi:hypothetical protein